jgi:probable phosphoglycerate mutase
VPATDFEVVYLARHGQTEWNLVGRRQGRLDSPLTPKGLDQARRVGATVGKLEIDGLFSSPLGRAIKTAEICAYELGLPIAVIDELAETDHGQMSGLTSAEIELGFPGELERRSVRKFEWSFPGGGESYADLDKRAGVALQEISSKGARRPLIVSHEMIGRMLLRHLLQEDPHVLLTWSHPQDVVYQIDIASGAVAKVPD